MKVFLNFFSGNLKKVFAQTLILRGIDDFLFFFSTSQKNAKFSRMIMDSVPLESCVYFIFNLKYINFLFMFCHS